jgi:NAD(P)-dependent dehydrogenase (short-subunit alcohol dehydrogenase family)
MRLKDKVAIVTGAGSGIGKKIAETFLKEGASVVFSDIAENNSEVDGLGEQAKYVKCDVSKPQEVKDLIERTVKFFNKVDVIVNNAGVGALGGILEVTDQDWDKVIAVNLSGTMHGMREAAKEMVSKNISGSIINISSILGKVGFKGAIGYCASKGGVVQLTHAGALDLASNKIRVNAIAPGFIKTNMTKDVLENQDFKNLITSSTPLGYVGETQDIANAALYLASDESKYVTGNVLYVDGGWTAK